MLWGDNSIANDLVKFTIAALDAQYAEAFINPVLPNMDAIETIFPLFCFNIYFTTAFVHKNTHFRLIFMVKSRSSSVISAKGFIDPTPALFTKISILPKVLIVSSTKLFTSVDLETSHCTAIALHPRSLISSTTFWQSANFVLDTTTFAQFCANSRAVAFHIPLLDPVIITTLFLNFIFLIFI